MSLRRSKQFATVGPASGGRLEVGLNLKDVEPTRSPGGGDPGCAPTASGLSDPAELDDEVVGWLREAVRAGLTVGPSGTLSRGPVAQRQSTGLLIPWSWVRIPPAGSDQRLRTVATSPCNGSVALAVSSGSGPGPSDRILGGHGLPTAGRLFFLRFLPRRLFTLLSVLEFALLGTTPVSGGP